jgi:ribonuclease BN (tRNA processing enzyme)
LAELSLTVLGASPAWPSPGGACSGYLISRSTDHVLVECGFGVLARLRERLPLDQLGAVVISHLHADHFMDLVPLRYGLKYGYLRKDPQLPLFAPPGARQFFADLGRVLDGDLRFFDGIYCLQEYRPGTPVHIGSLRFDFRRVKHYIPSHAMAIDGDQRLVFSADSAPCRALVEHARGAELFLCESALTGREEDDPASARRGHMTAVEAGEVARAAGVRRLLLTHYHSDPQRNGHTLAEASTAFGGPTELAEEGRSYTV